LQSIDALDQMESLCTLAEQVKSAAGNAEHRTSLGAAAAVVAPTPQPASPLRRPQQVQLSQAHRSVGMRGGTPQLISQQRPEPVFSAEQLARVSSEFGAPLAERSHLADGTELHMSYGLPTAAQCAVSRTRRRISRMLEAPPSMRGFRNKPINCGEAFSQSQQLPSPATAFCSISNAQAASQASASTSGMLEGRVRGGSLAEESSACLLPVRASSSVPAASEPGADAGGASLSA